MAIFRIGQRVRIANAMEYCPEQYRHLLGTETVITSERYERHGDVGYRTAATDPYPNCFGVPERFLSPLTDPKEDAFIAKVKSWGPLKVKPTYAELLDDVLAHIRGGSL